MKKILGFVLSMMLVMGFMLTSVSAAGNISIAGDVKTVKAGDSVTIGVYLPEEATFVNYGMYIDFDESVLTLNSISGAGIVANKNYAPGRAMVAYSTSEDVTYSAGTVLFSLNFTVAASAKIGTYPVEISLDNVKDENYDVLTPTISDGAVIIECSGHVYDNGVVTTPATCDKAGVKTFTCTVPGCGYSYTEDIPALGHDYDKANGKVTKAPTCTETGIMTYTCKNDSSHTTTEVIPKLDHAWDEGKVTKAPTCTDAGLMTYTCKNDPSHTRTEAIPALGHKWDEGKVTTAATCEEPGVKTYTCTVCGHVSEEQIPALGHKWTEWTVTKAPTKDAPGEESRTCLNCGEVQTREIPPAKDQVPDTGVRSNNYAAWIAVAAVAGVAVAFIWKRKTAK